MEKVNEVEWFIARKEKNNKPHLKAYCLTHEGHIVLSRTVAIFKAFFSGVQNCL